MKQAERSRPNERQTMEYLINKRGALQTRLEQLTRKNQTQQQKIMLFKIIHTWKTHIQEQKQLQKMNKTTQQTEQIYHKAEPPRKIHNLDHNTYENWKRKMTLQHIHNQIRNGRKKRFHELMTKQEQNTTKKHNIKNEHETNIHKKQQ